MRPSVIRSILRCCVAAAVLSGLGCPPPPQSTFFPPTDAGIPQTLPPTCMSLSTDAGAGGDGGDSGSSDAGVVCTCPTGYVLQGTECDFVNACATDAGNPCGSNMQCVPEVGSFSCVCASGYTATDAGVCVPNSGSCGTCDPNATCIGSQCVCNSGFVSDGGSCIPNGSDPCAVNNGGCSPNALCLPGEGGSVTCTCEPGFSGDGGTCTAVGCQGDVDCVPGAPFCLDGTCVQCRVAADCTTGQSCNASNRCVWPAGRCGQSSDCTGSPSTPVCDTGNNTCVQCVSSSDCRSSEMTCNGTNHCVWITGHCGQNADCSSLPSTPLCNTANNDCVQCLSTSNCPTGEQCVGNACQTTANPCSTNNGGCSPNAICSPNGSGGVNCTCDSGFSGDGGTCVANASGQVGDSCSTPGRPGVCQSGLTCTSETSPFNSSTTIDFCTNTTCTVDSDCGTSNGFSNVCANGICFAGCSGSSGTCDTSGLACWSESVSSPTSLENFCDFSCTSNPTLCGYGVTCNSRGACTQRLCTSNASCNSGQVCVNFGGGLMMCAPNCNTAGCPTGPTCNSSDGACEYSNYQPCDANGTCAAGNICIIDQGTNIEVCLADCSNGQACPSGQTCGIGLTNGGSVCGMNCTSGTTTCPSSTTCEVGSTGATICVP